jgi:hypothetical protein
VTSNGLFAAADDLNGGVIRIRVKLVNRAGHP